MTNEELAVAAQGGDKKALRTLWDNVRCLCFVIARRVWERHGADRCAAAGVTLDDLTQEAYFAFLYAVKAFDPSTGYRFTAYLKFPIKNVLARACGYDRCKKNPLDCSISLDLPAGNAVDGEEAAPLSACIPDKDAEQEYSKIDTKVYAELLHDQLEAALRLYCMSAQREILHLRYYEGKSICECADELGITKSAVCSRETAALRALRRCPMWKQLYALLPHEE